MNLRQLAQVAGVHPATVYRSARGDGDNRLRTIRRLLAALEAEEARVAEHLAKLHPAEAKPAAPLSITAIEEGDAA